MTSARVIPCLMLRNTGLVKTTKFKHPVYLGDVINVVKLFNDMEADELGILRADEQNPRLMIDIVRSWLERSDRKWLLIFDNAKALFISSAAITVLPLLVAVGIDLDNVDIV